MYGVHFSIRETDGAHNPVKANKRVDKPLLKCVNGNGIHSWSDTHTLFFLFIF